MRRLIMLKNRIAHEDDKREEDPVIIVAQPLDPEIADHRSGNDKDRCQGYTCPIDGLKPMFR